MAHGPSLAKDTIEDCDELGVCGREILWSGTGLLSDALSPQIMFGELRSKLAAGVPWEVSYVEGQMVAG
jgi:hypothetical protein